MHIFEVVLFAVYSVLVVFHQLFDDVLLNLDCILGIDAELDMLRNSEKTAEIRH